MTDLTYDDGPELVPPAELLELRSHLAIAPRAEVRRTHLDAIVAQVRNRPRTTWGRVAASAGRSAAAVVVTLTVTSGLAAAQVLPEPAQKILSSMSDRITGRVGQPEAPEPTPEAEPAPVADSKDTATATESPRRTTSEPIATTTTSSTVVQSVEVTTTTTTAAPTTTVAPSTTTTIPGPSDSGSGGDPTAPVTEPVEAPAEEPVEEPTGPNEPTEPSTPAQPTGGTVKVVDDGGTAQEGGSG